MFSLSNQIKPPDDDHQHQLQPQDCDNSFKPTFLYNSFEHTLDFTSNSWLPPIQSKKRKNDEEDTRVVQSTGRKDRHSKVRTARGPRDRRVRLSPRTAIQFYDVQDRLGYDRPSKAIDWLIKEAKSAIDDLNARTDPPFMADPFCQQGFLAPAGWPPSGGLEREPLQSSLIDDSIVENSDFSGFNFCDELLSVTASAALMKEDERPSSMASFLQYED